MKKNWSGLLVAVLNIKESNLLYPLIAATKLDLSKKIVLKLNELQSTFVYSSIRYLRYKSAIGLNLEEFYRTNESVRHLNSNTILKGCVYYRSLMNDAVFLKKI